jgi:hypothetical protein
MSVVYYVLPVLAIILVVVLSRWGQQRALQGVQNMTPEQARARVNQYFAGSFDLQPGETLYAVWVGEEYQGEQSAAGQVAGAAINQISKAAIGLSTYVPQVQVGVTSTGRVLIAREYSEMGDRGNFKQVAVFGRGTRAVDAATARPGQAMKPPMTNPIQPSVPPDFVQFLGQNGEKYEVWMHAGQAGNEGFIAAFHHLLAQVPGAAPA